MPHGFTGMACWSWGARIKREGGGKRVERVNLCDMLNIEDREEGDGNRWLVPELNMRLENEIWR